MMMRRQGGFIAVISAVVIGVLLLSITLSLGLTGFFARFNILYVEYKERSFSLAEACAETALLKLAANSGYIGNESISLGTLTCTIGPITQDVFTHDYTIKTKASFPQIAAEKAVTNLVIIAGNSTLGIKTWEEVPN